VGNFFILGTKQRAGLINPEIESDLHAYLGGIIRELGGTALATPLWSFLDPKLTPWLAPGALLHRRSAALGRGKRK
jgi:hypothetical protein